MIRVDDDGDDDDYDVDDDDDDDAGDVDDNDEVSFLRQMLWNCYESKMISVDCSLWTNNDIISHN